MPAYILTVIGPDRPGLVRALSHAVATHGGNWQESRMARLAGQFAGIVMVEAPATLLTNLQALENQGLRIHVESGREPVPQSGTLMTLEVVGNDRPGIVRDITQVLADCRINIEELTTGVEPASFSGGTLFRANATLRAPAEDAVAAARSGLEALGHELMVEFRPQ